MSDSSDLPAVPEHVIVPSTQVSGNRGRPLKILIGADTFSPDVNGAARFAERLASGMAARGHEIHIVAPAASRNHGTWKEIYDGQVVTAHRLRSWRWYPHDWLRFALPWHINRESERIVEEVQPDVVHFQSHIIVGRGLSIAAAKRGIRIVGTNHFMPENMLEFTLLPTAWHDWAVGLAWRAARRTFGRAESITTPTRRAAEFLEKSTGLTGVHAISCGINAGNYTPNLTPRTENRILFVGRITGEKQLDILLGAFALLPKSLDTTLEIVGGGDQRRNLEHLATTLGIANRVKFTGYVTETQLREAYSRATVFAMPSIAELQSIATMEAMASALPIVAANAMALPHLVHENENGFLFSPGDQQELADKLEYVLTLEESELLALKMASLEMIEAHDIERTLNIFEKLYRGEVVVDGAPLADLGESESA